MKHKIPSVEDSILMERARYFLRHLVNKPQQVRAEPDLRFTDKKIQKAVLSGGNLLLSQSLSEHCTVWPLGWIHWHSWEDSHLSQKYFSLMGLQKVWKWTLTLPRLTDNCSFSPWCYINTTVWSWAAKTAAFPEVLPLCQEHQYF